MAFRSFNTPEIGVLKVYKRKGSANIRLSVTHTGEIRATMPAWLPYSAAIKFAIGKKDWLDQQRSKNTSPIIQNLARIGKSHRVNYRYDPTTLSTQARILPNTIRITSSQSLESDEVQLAIVKLAEKTLKKEAAELLPQRLEFIAKQHGLKYSSVGVRKLKSRWGSCSSKKDITLSYYLMQLSWELIDYVLLHELMHTKHMHHGPAFWTDMTILSPKSKLLRKELQKHQPRVEPEFE